MQNNVDDEIDEQESTGIRSDQLRSYLAFARYAVHRRWRVSVAILVSGVVLTCAAFIYLPRTFACTTVLMTLGNPILDGMDNSNALAGASDLIQRHENLEAIIQEVGLVRYGDARRPPILRLRDRIWRSLLGEPSAKLKVAELVGTLENRISVTAEKGDLTIKAEWTDAGTSAQLAEAARESFLKARHSAEISAFEEKMAILDVHASKLRVEIGTLAQQLKTARDQKLDEVRGEAAKGNAASAAAQPRVARAVVHRAVEPDTQTPALKEKLEGLKAKLSALETDRDRRLREEQNKFEEMKLRLTPLHPQVITEGERVAMLQQVPSDVALLRAEVKDIEGEIKLREAFGREPSEAGAVGAAEQKPSNADPLPPDITDLLQRDNLDPALTAQLSGTVMRYSALRNDILSTRIDLDTAQAAFNHRYQVIIPADIPTKPEKPKPVLIWGAGLALSLLLSLLVPVLGELKRGIIVESWQVEHLQLPVLAELRLPPYSPD